MLVLALLLTFNLGDFRLESGEVIQDCKIGYRVDGTLNEDRSNAILVPTWFAGRSADLGSWVGPGKMFDTTKYYVIVVDALGDGVSSSPSNSGKQPGAKFPKFTIRDMVRTQHALVTRELNIDQLYCVAGLSMGGTQAYQWVVSYPEAMKKAISIVGTPKQTAHDIILWKTQLDLLESVDDARKAMGTVAMIQTLEIYTPAWIAKNVPDPNAFMETRRKSFERLDPFDYMSQLRAMIPHDIGAVTSIKPKMLIVVAAQDQMVNPAPSREFARVTGSEFLVLANDCGHLATTCEPEVLMAAVTKFLAGVARTTQ